MAKLLLSDLIDATGGALLSAHATAFEGASIDTRTLRPGALFFAISAARDGHAFPEDAVRRGAGGLVVEHGRKAPTGITVLAVENPRRALGLFARAVRRKLAPRVAAVTGSNGKTTTKDLLATALGDGTHKTEG